MSFRVVLYKIKSPPINPLRVILYVDKSIDFYIGKFLFEFSASYFSTYDLEKALQKHNITV
jgi:hypothetical protein